MNRSAKKLLCLAALLCVSVIAATGMGAVSVPFLTVLKILLNLLPGLSFSGWEQSTEIIIWSIRLPRVLMAMLIGGGLAVSGLTLQALFRNPLADPGIIGISSGGGLAAVIAISSGFAATHVFALPLAAFLGALGTLILVYLLATQQGSTPVATLLLAGIAVGIFMGALLSLMLSRLDSYAALREILFWLMGGLEGRGWQHFGVALWPILIASLVLFFFSRDLNLLLLEGAEGAQALGMNVKWVHRILLVLSSLITGTAVAFSGTVPFVGLIVPHITRLLFGPDHRSLLPATFLGGAILLVISDILARTLVAPEELRLGTITALIGVPFFLYLLRKNRQTTLV